MPNLAKHEYSFEACTMMMRGAWRVAGSGIMK